MTLSECRIGDKLKITEIGDGYGERSRLWEFGVYENCTVIVVGVFFGGTVALAADGAVVAVGGAAAENIKVEYA